MEPLQNQLQESLGSAYTLERELPRGGMSRVFVATENALARRVVIKVLAPELTRTLSAERFKREIALAARLQHPNIVPLLSAGIAGERLYYTMPLVDGESLRDRMARERPMSVDNVCRILDDVASALDYAHSEGIVHRDMKPENVMFFHGRAVVLDFGIGKALSAAQTITDGRITQAGVSLGTPMYIAPEQAMGDPNLDYRADIYALGILGFEMLTGHPPFSGRTPQEIVNAQQRMPAPQVTTKRAGIPPRLANIVMQCLEKDPARRPREARAIVEAIEQRGERTGMAAMGARIPAWVPWIIAAVSTAVAVLLAARR